MHPSRSTRRKGCATCVQAATAIVFECRTAAALDATSTLTIRIIFSLITLHLSGFVLL